MCKKRGKVYQMSGLLYAVLMCGIKHSDSVNGVGFETVEFEYSLI
jgi:hypothetical protein